MLTALMDGRALTVSELAAAAGVALPTATGHLSRLEQPGLLSADRQGRHRYLRLSGPDVALVLEGLMGLAQRAGAVPVRTGPNDVASRAARVCYDHLAGWRAVALSQALVRQGWLDGERDPVPTATGRERSRGMAIDVAALERRRGPICRACLDWSERRHHLGGALDAAILGHIVGRRWASRGDGRVVRLTVAGSRAFASAFGTLDRAIAG